jgi:8-amino-7-oxononanoate synthase
MFHVKRDPLSHLEVALEELERAGLRRRPLAPLGPAELSFCSNDYLGLAAEASPCAPSGSGASRLIAGERDEHRRLERAFSTFVGADDALAFSSGYAANVGAVSALASPGDLIVSDALNHASLIDGARLSRARVEVVPHLDLAAVEAALRGRTEARAWVLCESYYSMDADGPDLGALRAICDRHGAGLVVDEAHAIGVLGPGGRGRCVEAGIRADVLVGTLGKALGAQGAVVGGTPLLRDWLWNRARSFVFSTGLAPSSAAAATRSIARVVEEPERVATVTRLAARLREGLREAGIEALGFGHVVPIILGDRAMGVAERLRACGIHVQAVRPPTVPEGTARIRLTVTARHSEADVERAVGAVAESCA